MITYAAFFVDETTDRNRRFWNSLLGDNYALVTSNQISMHKRDQESWKVTAGARNEIVISVNQVFKNARRYIVGPRATARNATHTKPRSVTKRTPPSFVFFFFFLFFLILHKCSSLYFHNITVVCDYKSSFNAN